jgi:hypothetical protein
VHAQFAALASDRMPGVPAELCLAAVGATNEVVSSWVAGGRAAELPALEEVVVDVHLALVGSAVRRAAS